MPLCLVRGLHLRLTDWWTISFLTDKLHNSATVQFHVQVTETLSVHYLDFTVCKDKPHPLTWGRLFIATCPLSFSCCEFSFLLFIYLFLFSLFVFFFFFFFFYWKHHNTPPQRIASSLNQVAPLLHSPTAIALDMALNIASIRDTKWLTLEVCRQFQRGTCSRSDEECKFAHPPKSCQVENGRVIACFDSLKVRTSAYVEFLRNPGFCFVSLIIAAMAN